MGATGVHDRGRMRCAQFPHDRCWKHRSRLALAFLNTTGSFNTALGTGALLLNNGDSNTATGAAALLLNTTGHDNTAAGVNALASNTTGPTNTAASARSPATPSAGAARLSVIKRSGAKPAAGAARPLVLTRSRARATAKPTLLLALQRSKAPPAAAIRPMVLQRSATALATTTPPWALERVEMSPRLVTLSVSARESWVRTWTTVAISEIYSARPQSTALQSSSIQTGGLAR